MYKLVVTEDFKVQDYIDVRNKVNVLGCTILEGLALLPRNFGEAKSNGFRILINNNFLN